MAGECVLVVDDSLVYRDLLVNHVLTPSGYVPLTANDGEAGLHVALQKTPDLIIMDMQMPGMTGIQVLEALHEAGSEIPVIMMTLHGSEDLAVRAAKSIAPDTPVMATMTFDKTPRGFFTVMGVSIRDAVENLESAGADILGSNCGNGIENMISIAREFRSASELPLLIQANAGLPELREGKLV